MVFSIFFPDLLLRTQGNIGEDLHFKCSFMCTDGRAGSAQSSNQQADSDWATTLEYLEDGGSGQADFVPPLPEPLSQPARQVICCDTLASSNLPF